VRNSRRGARFAALGAATAVIFSGLGVGTAGAALGAPVLEAPEAGSLAPDSITDAQKNLELTWAAVEGASSYTVQILDDDNEDLAVTYQDTARFNRWAAPVQLPAGEYRWRVRANKGSVTSGWTRMATLVRGWEDRVTGLSAAPGPVPSLSWEPLQDASFYEIEINRRAFSDSNYSRGDSFVCYTQQTTFSPYAVSLGASFDKAPGDMGSCSATSASKALATDQNYILGETYHWRVRGRDGASDERTTTFPASPGACLRPWVESGVTVASDGAVTVKLPVQPPTSAAAPECSSWSAPSTFVPTLEDLSVADMEAPTGLAASPLAEEGGTRVTADPTFSWDAVPHALKYRFYLSRDRLINSVDLAAETEVNSLTPVAGLGLTSTNRYWAVQACGQRTDAATDVDEPATDNDCGDISEPHAISQVTANPTAPLTFTAQQGYLLATWSTHPEDQEVPARSQARSFDVAVRNLETGVETVTRTDRLAYNADGATSSLVLPSSTLAEGRYTFRTRPVDQAGRVTAWSGSSEVAVVDRTDPKVRLISGTGVSGRTPVTLSFSEPLTGVSSATVAVQDGRGRVAGTTTLTGPTTAQFTPSAPWLTGGYLSAWSSGDAVDRAGKPVTVTATSLRTKTIADSVDPVITFTGGDTTWTTRTASDAVGRSYRSTTDDARTPKFASATVTAYGTSVSVGACKSPTSGVLRIYVDGRLRTSLNLYRTWSGCDASATVGGLPKGVHQVSLVALADGKRGVVSVDRVTVA
jgi:hypothetical protein